MYLTRAGKQWVVGSAGRDVYLKLFFAYMDGDVLTLKDEGTYIHIHPGIIYHTYVACMHTCMHAMRCMRAPFDRVCV